MENKTTISATQYGITVSASQDNEEGLSPSEVLSLFKQVFLGLTYSPELWEQAITNELDNF